ncbi:hypothetical protein [Ruminococcus sp. HUN007]|uniref:hypothetical protein n=1 Tax=Ruminococcus sp. HUN007 TaxID=1514668 RepID=UPI0005D14079|nr:hypothetical protein [Ruminococcus sp. HUN007]
MKALATICLLLFIAVPVFAVFQLLHRLETHKVDEGASRRFYEALREEYGLVPEKPKRALTEDERIALAKKISEDPYGNVTAVDVMEKDESDTSEKQGRVSLAKPGDEPAAETEETEEEKNKRLSREKALATVNAMLGSSGQKNKKGDALAELQRTLEKYRKQ